MTHPTRQHFIVIGNPIAHSKSPEIHQAFAEQTKLDIQYRRQYCPDDPQSFQAVVDAFFNGGGVGANVTVPFKQQAYSLCAEQGGLSEHAKVAGAVNTLLLKDGKVYGDNTDGQGLVNHLRQLGWPLQDAKVAILGAGGASRGVILPLIEAGIGSLTVANRTPSKAQDMLEQLCTASPAIEQLKPTSCALEALTGDFDIIINATSIGLSNDKLPLDERLSCDYAYDMMYGRDLPFLTHFEQQGASVSEGYGMLIGQAALSFERWTGATVDTSKL
ncbi:shikimate dehydrogenase [Psychrobacter sp. FDAARGOS_221]|uniref:shikimate dehydrogenase n=1 Tax=Psychrobacter sp. FDAARGOS_221 TaxID=1975705 RepID=UPI000BB5713E|nr:shikimate dehydrogenase [Psychrobacter sp. FDAARGOS_221]PNK60624.1 shikimate dehydrogenase [Psychrobacter sp. FDAARGOS_221]